MVEIRRVQKTRNFEGKKYFKCDLSCGVESKRDKEFVSSHYVKNSICPEKDFKETSVMRTHLGLDRPCTPSPGGE